MVRLQVIASFVTFLFFGVPVWLKTTTTPRADLPFQQIGELSLEKFIQKQWDINIDLIVLGSKSQTKPKLDYLQNIQQKFITQLENKNAISSEVRYRWIASTSYEHFDQLREKVLSGSSSEWDEWLGENKFGQNGRYQFYIIIGGEGNSSKTPFEKVLLGTKRHGWVIVRDLESVLSNTVLADTAQLLTSHFLPNSSRFTMDSKKSFQAVTVTPASHYTLCFTLLNANPNTARVQWDFETAFGRYLKSFLDTMEPLAHFTIISQVLHYGRLLKSPVWSKSSAVHYIPENELPLFINPHQWALDLTDTSTA